MEDTIREILDDLFSTGYLNENDHRPLRPVKPLKVPDQQSH